MLITHTKQICCCFGLISHIFYIQGIKKFLLAIYMHINVLWNPSKTYTIEEVAIICQLQRGVCHSGVFNHFIIVNLTHNLF